MALTKWNELKGKGPGYRPQEGDEERMEKEVTSSCTEYDFDKCKLIVDGTINGSCSGKDENMSLCVMCPYFIGNKKCCCDTAEVTDGCLENEIFMKLYGSKEYSLDERIDLLKRVIVRLERVREQNASEALTAFLNNYCGDDKCRTCPFNASNNHCLIKREIAELKRKEG